MKHQTAFLPLHPESILEFPNGLSVGHPVQQLCLSWGVFNYSPFINCITLRRYDWFT